MTFTNTALNATTAVWTSSGYNSTIDNSSMELTLVYTIDNVSISTFQFNTTDGKRHTVNVSDNYATGSIDILDIDNEPIMRNSNATSIACGIITGRILDEHGIDLVDANVTLWQNGKALDIPNNPQWSNEENLPSDELLNYTLNSTLNHAYNIINVYAESYYRFDHLTPGRYQVTAEMEGVRGSVNVSVTDNTKVANVVLPDYIYLKPDVRVILRIKNYTEDHYTATILYSNDSNIAAGADCWLSLDQPIKGKYLTMVINPSILVPGVIIGLNDYGFSKGINGEPDEVYVGIPENTSWMSKVKLLTLENASDKYIDSIYNR